MLTFDALSVKCIALLLFWLIFQEYSFSQKILLYIEYLFCFNFLFIITVFALNVVFVIFD